MSDQVNTEECNVCGEGHATSACPLLGQAHKVEDKSVPSRARLSVPLNLALQESSTGEARIVAREDIPVGTQFGPVEAPRYRAFKGDPRFKLKVFPKKGRPTCLDTSDEYQCNWMCFVEPAPDAASQNLIAYQLEQDVYFSVQKPIWSGDALFVGYAPPYGRKMAGPVDDQPTPHSTSASGSPSCPPPKRKRGRPPRTFAPPRSRPEEHVKPEPAVSSFDAAESNATSSFEEGQEWKCSQCGRRIRDSVVFARHLQDHYRPTYLRELARRHSSTAGRRGRARGRPRGPGWYSSSVPSGVDTSNGEQGNETVTAVTVQASRPNSDSEQGAVGGKDTGATGEQLNVQAFDPQLGSDLDGKGATHLIIQLEDGSIHEITSFHAGTNQNSTAGMNQLPAIPATAGALDLLGQLHLEGPHKGNEHKGSCPEDAQVSQDKQFQALRRETPDRKRKPTTAQLALVTNVDKLEDESRPEGETGGEYVLHTSRDNSPCVQEEAVSTVIASTRDSEQSRGDAAPPRGVPRELHVAIEMLTSLPCQVAGQRLQNGQVNGSTGEMALQEGVNAAKKSETYFTLKEPGTTAGAVEQTEEHITEGIQQQSHQPAPVERYYRSIEQARLDRPRRPGRFRCDLCGKGFNQTLYLFRHIRKHTGEFTCSKCHRVFARKENMLNHTCGSSSGNEADAAEHPCTECGKAFASDRLLKRHMAKHTGQYTCTDCGKSYSTKEILANHSCAKHPLMERFSCGVCGKAFTRHTYLMKHLPMHTGQHSCPVCGKWLRSLDSLTNHLRMCTQVQDIERTGKATCSHCHKEFTNAADFRRHQYEHTHVHRCDVCGGRFRSLAALGAHVCQGRPMECEACGEVFHSVANLDEHKATHGEPQFKCESCGKEFFRKDSLTEHPCVNVVEAPDSGRRKDLRLLPLVCEVCGSTFASTSSLNVHRNLHGEKRFKCDVCGKRFHRKDLLLEHHAVHGDPTFPCPTCHKLFKTKKSLDVHSMIHEGVKRFKCSVCGKEFFQKGNLQKHEETHLSDRRHKCTVCQKVFTTRESLNRHILEHTRGKIFTCGICGRSFVKEHQLRNHHRMFHTNQTYCCQYCGLCLKLRHSLKRHLRKKHPDQEPQWRNPSIISAMLVTKEGVGDVSEDYTQGIGAGAMDEQELQQQQQLVFESQAAQESLEESLVATNMLSDRAEVLLEVEGFSSEELREAIASGRAQIKQGPTPDTIEISMPYDPAQSGRGEASSGEVCYVDGDLVLADDNPKTAADILGAPATTVSAVVPVAEHYVVSSSSDTVQDIASEASPVEEPKYVALPMYSAGRERGSQQAKQRPMLLEPSSEVTLGNEERYVVTGQEVPEGAHIIYDGRDIQQQTVHQGTIVLDDGTILQQEEESDAPADLLFYVLTTSETQEES